MTLDVNNSITMNFYNNMSTETSDNGDVRDTMMSPGLVSDGTREAIEILIVRILQPITLTFGICVNLINLYVFTKTGLKESVNISFFTLTFSDLWFLLMHFCSNVGNFIITLTKMYGAHLDYVFNGFEFSFVMTWYASIPYNISVLTTAFIALQKCLCVALPFQFKSMFNKTKTVIILITIYAFIISTFIPILNTFGFRATVNSQINATVFSLYFVDGRAIIEEVYYLMTRVMFNACEVIIFVSAITLSVCLSKASTFRQSATASNVPKYTAVIGDQSKSLKDSKLTSKLSDVQNFNLSGSVSSFRDKNTSAKVHEISLPMEYQLPSNSGGGKLSGRELQVVKSVMLVSFLFLLSNLPENVLYYVAMYVPEFGFGKVQYNIFLITYMIRSEVEFFNASIYIFVYYKFNSKFRGILNALWANFRGRLWFK